MSSIENISYSMLRLRCSSSSIMKSMLPCLVFEVLPYRRSKLSPKSSGRFIDSMFYFTRALPKRLGVITGSPRNVFCLVQVQGESEPGDIQVEACSTPFCYQTSLLVPHLNVILVFWPGHGFVSLV